MKKILNEWKKYLKENKEIENLLDKIRDVFFGAYDSWSQEYKDFHDEKINRYLSILELNARDKFEPDQDKIDKVVRGANIGLSLYWTDDVLHGAGDERMASYVIEKKFEILEKMMSEVEKQIAKNGLIDQVIDSVKSEKSDVAYPVKLAVQSGVINGQPVDDAYMTTAEGMNRFIIPMLKSKGYYRGPVKPVQQRRRTRGKYDAPMTPEEMLAQMKKLQK